MWWGHMWAQLLEQQSGGRRKSGQVWAQLAVGAEEAAAEVRVVKGPALHKANITLLLVQHVSFRIHQDDWSDWSL